MATTVADVMTVVAAEMVQRGVDVQHQWGKKSAERHDRLPRLLWVELDDDETIEPPYQTRYDLADGTQADAAYDRAVKLEVTVLAKDPETSEAVMNVLLIAGRHALSESAWEPGKVKKRGERPSSGSHARVLPVTVRLPVLDAPLTHGRIVTTAITAEVETVLD